MHDRTQGTPTAHGRTAQRFLSIIAFADARHIVRAAAKQIANAASSLIGRVRANKAFTFMTHSYTVNSRAVVYTLSAS